LKPKYLGIYRV
jgi:hypothetical protein